MGTLHLKISIVLFLTGIFLTGCTTTSEKHIQGQLQELAIPGVRFVDGKFSAQPGFHFEIDKNTGRTLLIRQSDGDPVAQIKPCDCVLLEGICDQGLTTDPDNDDQVTDVWCENCGVCTGGLDSIDGNLSLTVNFVGGGKCQ